MAKIDAGINIDVAYDTTPERALYSQIMKNPELSLEGAEYIGEKPGFMRVKANEWDLHDWDQYDRADEAERGRPKDGGRQLGSEFESTASRTLGGSWLSRTSGPCSSYRIPPIAQARGRHM